MKRITTYPGYVYFAGTPGLVKIGVTADLTRRLRALSASSPVPLALLGACRWPWLWMAHVHEAELHLRWSARRLHGEWFSDPDGAIAGMADLLTNCQLPDTCLWRLPVTQADIAIEGEYDALLLSMSRSSALRPLVGEFATAIGLSRKACPARHSPQEPSQP